MVFYSFSDKVYLATVWTLSSCGFAMNSLLLFIIRFKSPSNLSPYRILLANTAITQLLATVVYVMISPRVLGENFYIIVIYLGPSQFLGKDVCRMLYTAMCGFSRVHFSLNAYLSWMISMVYRCVVLLRNELKTKTVMFMCSVAYLIPASMMLTSISLKTCNNATEADILTRFHIPNIRSYSAVIIANILQPGLLYSICCCSILLIPILSTMFLCRWKILSLLKTPNYSTQTKLHIKRLVKALTLQSIIPLIGAIAPAGVYLLVQFGAIDNQVPSYVIVPCMCIGPLLDPMISIYYVYPYRMYVKRLLLPCVNERSVRLVQPVISGCGSNDGSRL